MDWSLYKYILNVLEHKRKPEELTNGGKFDTYFFNLAYHKDQEFNELKRKYHQNHLLYNSRNVCKWLKLYSDLQVNYSTP